MADKMSAAGQVTLEVFNPTGTVETTYSHAPRLDTLARKTICELWNGVFRGEEIFPIMRESLKKQFPGIKIIPYTEFPIGTVPIDTDETADLVKKRGCQGVIVGSAG